MRERQAFENARALVVWTGSVIVAIAVVGSSQGRAETFTADATVRRPNGAEASAQLTATIRSFATDADRDALIAAVKRGGTAARELLMARDDVGSIQVGLTRTAVKYAYARSTSSGRLITLISAVPILFIAGDLPGAKSKAGYDLGLVLLEVNDSSPGHGEVAPAARVRVDAQNAIVTEDYGSDVVRLSNVVRR